MIAGPKWEELDHPADIRLRIRGESLEEILCNAAEAMIAIMVDPCSVEKTETRDFEVEGDDEESLLISWLEEIHFIFDAERKAPAKVDLLEREGFNARGRLYGEEVDPSKHVFRNDIKAVTWHDLEMKHIGGHLEVTVLFDV